jgi:hypothetical protein
VRDKKLDPIVLKTLTQYAHKNEEGKFALNTSLIKVHIEKAIF